MTYQLLVSTMNCRDWKICENMGIQSDAIIINQSDFTGQERRVINGKTISLLSFEERGVGLSRNNALMRASADIVEFADDDMIMVDGYEKLVLDEFKKHPNADAILFSIDSLNSERPLLNIDSFQRVNRIGALKYGGSRLAVRREKVLYNNICFSLLFGGGAVYGSGEDTLFLQDLIKSGLRVYKSPVKIADVKQETSSWFNGYTDKYFFDKGALFAAVFPYGCYIYALLSAIKNRKNAKSACKIIKLYAQGIRAYKQLERTNGKNR